MDTIEHKIIKNNEVLIIQNVLDEEFFKKLQDKLFSTHFNWYFNQHMTRSDNNKDDYFFSHLFYYDFLPRSDFYSEYIIPIMSKLRLNALIEVKANLMTKRNYVYESNFHTDRDYQCRTAILYLNTCNGYTVIDEDEQLKIKCEENKVVMFDSKLRHKAVSQTDSERRIVININGF
jgi:hypothetical protein